ncbi:MAG: hypothetical protein WD491_00435, partial [Balneolales bacterium]
DYYRLLKEVTEDQEWEAWLIFILDAVRETSSHTLHKILAIKSLLDDTIEQIKKDHPQIYSRELVDVLFMQPYCKISHLVDNQIATRNTASKYLNTSPTPGFWKSRNPGGKRYTLILS